MKSLAGEALSEMEIGSGGADFDRRYTFVDETETRKGKPLTARQAPRLLGYGASVRDGGVVVTSPEGKAFTMDESLIEHVRASLGRRLSIEESKTRADSFHDAHDMLVINAASVRELSRERGAAVDPRRFRPNVIVDGDDARPFAEAEWIGRRFRIGRAQLEAIVFDLRCMITTIDPETLEQDPTFLKHLVDRHEQRFGVYCAVREPGRVAIGDELEFLT